MPRHASGSDSEADNKPMPFVGLVGHFGYIVDGTEKAEVLKLFEDHGGKVGTRLKKSVSVVFADLSTVRVRKSQESGTIPAPSPPPIFDLH